MAFDGRYDTRQYACCVTLPLAVYMTPDTKCVMAYDTIQYDISHMSAYIDDK